MVSEKRKLAAETFTIELHSRNHGMVLNDATIEDTATFSEYHGNAEVLQIIIDLYKRIGALEKKLIGSDRKIFSLRAVVKESGRKVQQQEYLVDELQFKFDCSLSHPGRMFNTLAKPSYS